MSQEHRQPGTTIAIVGLGLIGGSLGRALRLAGYHVTGFARRPAVRRRALALDAVDVAATNLRETADAEIIVLAVPVLATQAVFRQLAPQLHPGTIVTDVASTKARVLGWAAELLPAGVHFVGGHPMAGRETAGIEHAAADLFRGRTWCIVAPDATLSAAVAAVTALATATGALPLALDAATHDAAVAATSHVPFLAAKALAEAAFMQPDWPRIQPLASTGLRDTTRLASGNALMHRDICASNRAAILQQLDHFRERLAALATLIREGDDEELLVYFERLKTKRDRFVAYLDERRNA